MKIGNRTDAIAALRAHRAWMRWKDADEYTPWNDPFAFVETYEASREMVAVGPMCQIGNGTYRSVWTVDGNVAYKIGHGFYGWESSLTEWDVYRKFSAKMPKGMRLPKMHAYSFEGNLIIAVEVIHLPDPNTLTPRQYDAIPIPEWDDLPFSFMDSHEGNWRWDKKAKEFVILDFAA